MKRERERKGHKENEKQGEVDRNICCKKKEREREGEGKRRREKGNEREKETGREGERSQREDWKAYVKQIINFRLCKCPGKHFIFRFPPPDWPRGSSKFKMASHWLNGSLSARKAAPEKGGGGATRRQGDLWGKGMQVGGIYVYQGEKFPTKGGLRRGHIKGIMSQYFTAQNNLYSK
jgi:hypothetical protein